MTVTPPVEGGVTTQPLNSLLEVGEAQQSKSVSAGTWRSGFHVDVLTSELVGELPVSI